MARERIIAGIEIGTAKTVTIIASIDEENKISIIGVSSVKSKGIRKSQVVDIEEAMEGVVKSLESAERMAAYSLSSAFVSIGGSHISSQNSQGVVAVANPDKEITYQDVERAVEAAKAVSLPSSREIIHVLPRWFTVDSQDGIKDPVGMTGVRLEVDTHLVTGGSTSMKNLSKCVTELNVDVAGLVFQGLASSEAVLTDTEKELGVILVDIGAGTTDICIWIEGALSYSSVIPIGARNISNDLAIGLRVSLESAEKIKLALGKKVKRVATSNNKTKKEEDEINISDLGLTEGLTKVSRKTLIEGIIKPRLNEIFTMVGLEIKKSGFGGMTPSGLVITGGGAKTVKIVEIAKQNLAMPVRIGEQKEISGLVDEILTPEFAASVGLILYGVHVGDHKSSEFNLSDVSQIVKKIPIRGTVGKLIQVLRSFLP